MRELVFFVEGQSEKELLQGLVPRLVPEDFPFRVVPFEGKSDLEGQLIRRMRGYRNPEACFIVMRDQDSGECRQIKANIKNLCVQADRPNAVVRIACRETESFYLADLAAVESALGLSGLVRFQGQRNYRGPDYLGSPSKELEKLTRGAYQKVSGSRAIGPHLDLGNTRSNSFKVLIEAICRLASDGSA